MRHYSRWFMASLLFVGASAQATIPEGVDALGKLLTTTSSFQSESDVPLAMVKEFIRHRVGEAGEREFSYESLAGTLREDGALVAGTLRYDIAIHAVVSAMEAYHPAATAEELKALKIKAREVVLGLMSDLAVFGFDSGKLDGCEHKRPRLLVLNTEKNVVTAFALAPCEEPVH